MHVETIDESNALLALHLAKLHHAICGSHLPFDDEFTLTSFLRIANGDHRYSNAWLAMSEELPLGYFVGEIGTYLFSDAKWANQTIWFVHPEYRASRSAFLLFAEFEEWAREQGCIEIVSGASLEDVDMADRINKLFPRMGYKRVGSSFNKLIGDK